MLDERPPRVLAIDDDPDVLRWIDAILGDDVRLLTADSALAAATHLSGDRFDLVILDVDLPDMNGMDLLAELRAHDFLAHAAGTPVLVLTASDDARDYERGWDLEAVAYLRKPMDVARFTTAVEQALGA